MIKPIFKAIVNNNLFKNQLNKLGDAGYALRFLILANAAKDAINCGFYVNQSLNNKDIPEDKRNFVAALDMANGVLMITTQLLLGFKFTSKAVQEKLCKKFFGGIQEAASDFTKCRIAAHPYYENNLKYKLMNTVKNIPAGCKKGFTAISTIVITTVVAKRIIVPFIATPLASWVKNKYMGNKPGIQQDKALVLKQPATLNINTPVLSMPADQNFKQNINTGRASLQSYNNFAHKTVLFNP